MRFAVSGCVENKLSTPRPLKRIDDEHVRGGRNALRRPRWGCAWRKPWILASAEASHNGWPQIMAPLAVGGILARAADRHLHQHRRERRDDDGDQRADHAEAAAVAVAAEQEPELHVLGEHGDGAADGGGDRHDQRVAVLDVAELVRDHAGKLVAAQGLQAIPSRRRRPRARDCAR